MKYTVSIQSIVPGERWTDVAAFRWNTDAQSYAKAASRNISQSTLPDRLVRLSSPDGAAYYRDGGTREAFGMSLDDLIWETGL